jgi:hypothetical protein
MVYSYPTSEFTADGHRLKLLRLQTRVLRITDNLDRRTVVRKLHVLFNIRYVYDYITKLCRRQAEVIQNQLHTDVQAVMKINYQYECY